MFIVFCFCPSPCKYRAKFFIAIPHKKIPKQFVPGFLPEVPGGFEPNQSKSLKTLEE
jgi:hypothetical protein